MKALLETASAELRELIYERAKTHCYSPDEELFSAGERADYLPIIINGMAKMVQFPEPGKEVIIGIFGNGEMFALPPVIDGKLYPASAYAVQPSEILLLHRTAFRQLLLDSPEFTFAVLEWLADMLRQKTALIQTLAGGSAEQRVAGILLRLVENRSLPYKINLRREDIAKMAGLTTETAIRTVRRLAQREAIRIERGKIIISELAALKAYFTG